MKVQRGLAMLFASGGAVLAVACSTPQTGAVSTPIVAPTSSVRPTNVDGSGRSAVAFDPCHDLPSDVVRAAGYDPGSKNNTWKQPFLTDGGQTFLSCGFLSTMYALVIASGNATVSEQKVQAVQAAGAQVTPVSVDGRQGIMMRKQGDTEGCALAFSTSYGEILLSRTLRDPAEKAGMDPCGGLQDTAKIIASALPKGA